MLWRELGIDDPCPSPERWKAELVGGTLVSEHDGGVDGYVYVQTIGKIGYVRNLVVARAARGRGLGDALMRAAAASLRAAGVGHWHLNVKTENVAAISLYERLGMAAEHRSTALRFAWDRLQDLPGEAATVLPVAEAEDHDVERSLGLLSGQIAMARRHSSHVLTQLRDDELEAVGFAAFDPVVPGARIFRVARPSLAAALLGALRPHARHTDVALVIDDDDATTDLLIANGANVKLRLLHYSGPLPA
jgi:hypothetical protein